MAKMHADEIAAAEAEGGAHTRGGRFGTPDLPPPPGTEPTALDIIGDYIRELAGLLDIELPAGLTLLEQIDFLGQGFETLGEIIAGTFYDLDTYTGIIAKLGNEWDIFDIEDPSEKLEMMRKEFKKLGVELPESAAELEQWTRDMFESITGGAAGGGPLWDQIMAMGLTTEEVKNLLLMLDSTLDDMGAEGGGSAAETSVAYRSTVGITEMQANVIAGILETISINTDPIPYIDEAVQEMREMMRLKLASGFGDNYVLAPGTGGTVEEELGAKGLRG